MVARDRSLHNSIENLFFGVYSRKFLVVNVYKKKMMMQRRFSEYEEFFFIVGFFILENFPCICILMISDSQISQTQFFFHLIYVIYLQGNHF